jgi:hypothetical protein
VQNGIGRSNSTDTVMLGLQIEVLELSSITSLH